MKKLLRQSNFRKALARPLFAARYLKGKLKAGLSYRFGNGYSLPPGRVFFALTGRCNLNCRMCPQKNHPSFRDDMVKQGEAGKDDLLKAVDDIASFRPLVFVSGGELFLHPAWFDFLSHIKKRRLFCSIGTNGTMLERHASDLVNIGIDEISVSLDGPEPVHDAIRGVPGSYARAVRGMMRIVEEKDRLGVQGPVLNILFTITAQNYERLPEMVEIGESVGIDVLRVGHLNFLSPEDFARQTGISSNLFSIDHDTSWEGYVTNAHGIDPHRLNIVLDRLKGSAGPVKVVFFPDFTGEEVIRYYSQGPFRSSSFRNACLVPWDVAVVGPSGEVILCPNYIVGNLRERRFGEIWNNGRARLFRKAIFRMKQMPVCSRGCCFFYT